VPKYSAEIKNEDKFCIGYVPQNYLVAQDFSFLILQHKLLLFCEYSARRLLCIEETYFWPCPEAAAR
jgi:hypothetical protein